MRPVRPAAAPYSVTAAAGASGGAGVPQWFPTQLVVDPGFADSGSWTLTGAGVGTSAVAGGVLQVTSTTNVYFALPATRIAPLLPGTYTVTFTILNFVSGSISIIGSTAASLLVATVPGTARGANGTFIENLTLTVGGYIGLSGQGAAVVNSLQIDNMTIVRAS